MRFGARLKRGSAIDRLWRGQSRMGGELSGVPFHLVGDLFAGFYVVDKLEPDQVTALRHNPSVELDLETEPLGAARPVSDVNETKPRGRRPKMG